MLHRTSGRRAIFGYLGRGGLGRGVQASIATQRLCGIDCRGSAGYLGGWLLRIARMLPTAEHDAPGAAGMCRNHSTCVHRAARQGIVVGPSSVLGSLHNLRTMLRYWGRCCSQRTVAISFGIRDCRSCATESWRDKGTRFCRRWRSVFLWAVCIADGICRAAHTSVSTSARNLANRIYGLGVWRGVAFGLLPGHTNHTAQRRQSVWRCLGTVLSNTSALDASMLARMASGSKGKLWYPLHTLYSETGGMSSV